MLEVKEKQSETTYTYDKEIKTLKIEIPTPCTLYELSKLMKKEFEIIEGPEEIISILDDNNEQIKKINDSRFDDKGKRYIEIKYAVIKNFRADKVEAQNNTSKNWYYLLKENFDIIDAAYENNEHKSFLRWLIIKYIKRAGLKEGEPIIKDLAKAKYIIERWMEYENKDNDNSNLSNNL